MRSVTVVVFASVLVNMFAIAKAADVTMIDGAHQCSGLTSDSMTYNLQSYMFDGIKLTEQQRQQMRDLMQLIRNERLSVSIRDLDAMHELIIADNFDEAAVKTQAEKLAQVQVRQQVEMARVRNQMYRLLTPEQQAVLVKNHRQRMSEMQKLINMQQATSLLQDTGSNPQ